MNARFICWRCLGLVGRGKYKGHQKVLFGVFYRPPHSGDHIFTLVEHSIDLAVDTASENIVIFGDFNEDYLKDNNVLMKNIVTRYDMV